MQAKRILIFVVSLASFLVWLYILVSAAPDEGRDLRFPSDMTQLRHVSQVLQRLTETVPAYVLLLFSSAYVFKQTFAVPGSVFLNVLAGAVFGLPLGFALCFVQHLVDECCTLDVTISSNAIK